MRIKILFDHPPTESNITLSRNIPVEDDDVLTGQMVLGIADGMAKQLKCPIEDIKISIRFTVPPTEGTPE